MLAVSVVAILDTKVTKPVGISHFTAMLGHAQRWMKVLPVWGPLSFSSKGTAFDSLSSFGLR